MSPLIQWACDRKAICREKRQSYRASLQKNLQKGFRDCGCSLYPLCSPPALCLFPFLALVLRLSVPVSTASHSHPSCTHTTADPPLLSSHSAVGLREIDVVSLYTVAGPDNAVEETKGGGVRGLGRTPCPGRVLSRRLYCRACDGPAAVIRSIRYPGPTAGHASYTLAESKSLKCEKKIDIRKQRPHTMETAHRRRALGMV